MDQDEKKIEEQQAAEKAGQVAGRAALDYFTGGEYEQLRNKPIIGDAAKKAEDKIGKRLATVDRRTGGNLGKAAKKLDDAGALDAANKVGDMYGSTTGGTPGQNGGNQLEVSNKNNISSSSSRSKTSRKKDNSNTSFLMDMDSENDIESSNSDNPLDNISPKTKLTILGIALGSFFIVSIFVLIISVLYSVGDAFNSFIDGVVDFFTKDQQELEQDYYKKLVSTQTSILSKEGICIDVNLITAALTVNKEYNTSVQEGEENQDLAEPDYKQMQKQIERLGYMQIKHITYGWDKSLPVANGQKRCKPSSEATSEEKVSAATEVNFDLDGVLFAEISEDSLRNRYANGLDSTTAELVSRHDASDFKKFFTKKAREEENNEYVLYQPSASRRCNCQRDNNNNCIPGTEYGCYDVCDASLPPNKPELSIGDENDILNTMKDGVFYWNLVYSFIPDYYNDLLPINEPERTQQAMKIADEIYVLDKDMGPSHTCTGTSYYATESSIWCSNGITVEGHGTFDLEEYVAGVVSGEAYTGENIEALKAQAVAARTYVLKSTNGCQKSIKSSDSAQVFNRNISEAARRAANETKGEVLKYNNELFSAQYDSFCYDDKDCPDAVKNDDGTYTVTYTRLPAGEKHLVRLSESRLYGRIVPGGGHARGMSQLVSYQMADEGMTYDRILTYFYSDGVTITKAMSSAKLTNSTNIATENIDKILLEHGSSLEELNAYIAANVRNAGPGTREGVVAAAISLIQGFEDRTGMRLPYKWGGTREGVYGAVGSWHKGASSSVGSELDCSGFVSWAIFNGGYTYDYRTSGPWANAGNRRSWTYGMYDDKALPGDLIGSPGHIQMIVGVTDTGYIVAEASSWANGLRIKELPFKSGGQMELVDMSGYYASRQRQSSYPG